MIRADPGGMEAVSFDDIDGDVRSGIAEYAGPMLAAEGAAGDGDLTTAISDLCAALKTADSSSALALTGLSTAVTKAAAHYAKTDQAISDGYR